MSRKEGKLSSKDVLSNGDKLDYKLKPIDDGADIDADLEIINPDELFNDSNGDGQQSVAKELFNPKNPKIKTELSNEQIMIMSRLYPLSKKYYEPIGCFMLKSAMDEMILESISKNRASRTEFVETNREAQKNKDMGMFNRLLGGGGSQI